MMHHEHTIPSSSSSSNPIDSTMPSLSSFFETFDVPLPSHPSSSSSPSPLDLNVISPMEKDQQVVLNALSEADPSVLYSSYASRPVPSNLSSEYSYNTVTEQPISNLGALQEWNETMSYDRASKEYAGMIRQAKDRNDMTSLKPIQMEFVKWFEPLANAIKMEQEECLKRISKADRSNYGPILVLLKADKLAVITMHTVLNNILQAKHPSGAMFITLVTAVGEAVRAELGVQKVLYERTYGGGSFKDNIMTGIINDTSGRNKSKKVAQIVRRADKLLDDNEYQWSPELKAKVGAFLIAKLCENCIASDGKQAFNYEKVRQGMNKLVGYVTLSEFMLEKLMVDDLKGAVHVRHAPMVVPPRPWTSRTEGCYYFNQVSMMRTHGCSLQNQALDNADLTLVYRGLNALGKTPWKINMDMLETQEEAWGKEMTLGGLPSRKDYEVPNKPGRFNSEGVPRMEDGKVDKEHKDFPLFKERFLKHLENEKHYNKINQRNSELHSLRCDTMIKLDQARQFKDFEQIFFGWNLDFRGRAYPVPPNLNHLGSDLCRGLLSFSEKHPLTERGFYWLKVNLANLYGANKISMDARAKFVDDNWNDIERSAKDPLNHTWWNGADEPWQCLAVCKEIVKAVESGDPATFESSLFVSMDGSCNGLQHYAALGRDKAGGEAVNLTPMDSPQDVYTGVLNIVLEKIEEEVGRKLGEKAKESEIEAHESAKRIHGLVDRKVVKQTVMTSVYGVTFIGAKEQIMNRLQEKFQSIGLDVYDSSVDDELQRCSKYLASMTLKSLDEMFSNARQTMTWLGDVAAIVASQRQPMSWMTPLNLPCVQPYRRKKEKIVNTVVQQIMMVDREDNLPVSSMKQRSAFPPNYIHSLDSTHMLLTSVEMEERGLPFSAVHDSYWCHPRNVDVMNEVLREKFVELYSKPLLQELKKDLEDRYGKDCNFPEIPETGELDLEDIKNSKYFFQ